LRSCAFNSISFEKVTARLAGIDVPTVGEQYEMALAECVRELPHVLRLDGSHIFSVVCAKTGADARADHELGMRFFDGPGSGFS
jgi:hypothetical protein